MSQHMQALARANEIRLARAEIKREVKAGEIAASDLLREQPLPDALSTMLPAELLCTASRFPINQAHRMLASLDISYTRRLGELTYRQRVRLAEKLSGWDESHPTTGRRARSHRTRQGLGRVGSRAQAA